jgi:hypothetical protein
MKSYSTGDGMGTGEKLRRGAVLLFLAWALAVEGQTVGAPKSGPRVLDAPPQATRVQASAPNEVVREIDDPHTGARWLLMRDLSHPGGPGRLLLVESTRNPARQAAGAKQSRVEPRPVLHAGDQLIVEENTPVVESHLEAVALGPAVIGSAFNVRLTMGGKVVRAVALAPGRAVLQPETEARP